jgi:hypothetical protein
MSAVVQGESAGHLVPDNPFLVESPEKLTPRQLKALFVEEYTQIETVRQRRHTFIWGSRGSGKSMMLRYLEPQCLAIGQGDIRKVFAGGEPFLGVYCPCKEGQLNKTEFDTLDESAATVVSELYTQSKSDYANKVRLIAERRLELSPVPEKNIDRFLPANETERQRFEEIKRETAAEWEKAGKPGRLRDALRDGAPLPGVEAKEAAEELRGLPESCASIFGDRPGFPGAVLPHGGCVREERDDHQRPRVGAPGDAG